MGFIPDTGGLFPSVFFVKSLCPLWFHFTTKGTKETRSPQRAFCPRLQSLYTEAGLKLSVADCRSGADYQWWATGPWQTIPIARPARTSFP